MVVKSIIFTILFTVVSQCCKPQALERFNSFSYNVNEGLLQSTIWDMSFDKQNFCWISFPNGIQKFDGKNFTIVPVQPGLPDDKWLTFYKCKNGTLLFSHTQGISKYDLENNRFIEVFNYSTHAISPARFIGETDAVYIFTEDAQIFSLDTLNYAVKSIVQTGLPTNSYNESFLKISENIVDNKITILINSRLYQWDLKLQKLIYSSATIPGIFFTFLQTLPDDKVLYHSFNNVHSLQIYDFKSGTSQLVRKDKMLSGQGFRSSVYQWQNNLLFSYFNRLYETDSSMKTIKKELVNFQNKPLTGVSNIGFIRQDNFNNLYLVSSCGGFTKVIRHNLPIKYYGTSESESNFVMSILADKKHNRILAGTRDHGLFIFDTLQQVVKHIKKLPGRSMSFSVTAIAKDNSGNYLLFIPGEKLVWKLSSTYNLTPINIAPLNRESVNGFSYFGNVLLQSPQQIFLQSQHMFYKIDFRSGKIAEYAFDKIKANSGVFYNNKIVNHGFDELTFYDTASFKEVKRIPFPNTGGVRCFAVNNNNELFIGTNKGIFKTDTSGKILLHLNKYNGLADECIYAMVLDKDQNLWCSTNKGVLLLNKQKSITHFKKEEGLQENEFNTNAVTISDDGEVFFGGVNGISSFFPAAMTKENEKDISLLFTSIKINNKEIEDKVAWQVENIAIKKKKNNISFDFIALAKNCPGQYIYQYKMDGIDEDWQANSELQTVRYSLPPGKYVFQVYASRFFNKDAKPVKEIAIIIYPPFWKAWWFITLLVVAGTAGLVLLINQKNKLYGWANKNGKSLEFETLEETIENGRRLFRIGAIVDGELLAEAKAYNKKEASQAAAQIAVEKLGLI